MTVLAIFLLVIGTILILVGTILIAIGTVLILMGMTLIAIATYLLIRRALKRRGQEECRLGLGSAITVAGIRGYSAGTSRISG